MPLQTSSLITILTQTAIITHTMYQSQTITLLYQFIKLNKSTEEAVEV